MAEEALDEGLDDDVDAPDQKKVSGKRLIIFAVAILLLVIGGGVGAAFLLGLFGGEPPPVAEAGAV